MNLFRIKRLIRIQIDIVPQMQEFNVMFIASALWDISDLWLQCCIAFIQQFGKGYILTWKHTARKRVCSAALHVTIMLKYDRCQQSANFFQLTLTPNQAHKQITVYFSTYILIMTKLSNCFCRIHDRAQLLFSIQRDHIFIEYSYPYRCKMQFFLACCFINILQSLFV